MDITDSNIIKFEQLKNHQLYEFNFCVKDDFFTAFPKSRILGGNIDVSVGVIRNNEGLILDFHLRGNVVVTCSKCLEDYHHPIEFKEQIVAHFDDVTNFDGDNNVSLNKNVNQIDVSRFIYEFCDFALPISCKHPEDEDGNAGCNKEMLELLETYNNDNDTIDPRWEQLKQFIN